MHMMIDIETLSQSPRAAVISIGACTFNHEGVHDTFKVNIKPESAKEFGMIVSNDTVDWWAKQSKEVREAALERNVVADYGLKTFADWVKRKKPSHIWSQGSYFDITILEHAFKCVKVDTPWMYWQIMDCRTLFNLFGVSTKAIHEQYGSAHHDALNDATTQSKALITILNAMGWNESSESPIKI